MAAVMVLPLVAAASPPAWRGHAGDSEHTAASPAASHSLAHISAHGVGSWVSAGTAARDASMNEVPIGCAPAIPADGRTVYVAVSNGSAGYLASLNSASLAPVALADPSSGKPAWVTDLATASPTIGPDGDVYYGVVENLYPDHDGRGWLLHSRPGWIASRRQARSGGTILLPSCRAATSTITI